MIDLKYDSLLAVQDKVTGQLISELQLNLSPAETERLRPEASVNPVAYEYFVQGLDLHGQHKFPLAIKMLEKSTEIDPNYAPAWAYLGASYNSDAAFELGGREQYRRAQAAYERALAIRPNLLDAQIFLANLLVDTGKVEEAVPLLRDALKTNGPTIFAIARARKWACSSLSITHGPAIKPRPAPVPLNRPHLRPRLSDSRLLPMRSRQIHVDAVE